MMRGSARMNTFTADIADAPYWETKPAILRSVSAPRKIAVKAATPNKKGAKNSFNTYLSKSLIRIFLPVFLLES